VFIGCFVSCYGAFLFASLFFSASQNKQMGVSGYFLGRQSGLLVATACIHQFGRVNRRID
jgi:hypothetical protein